jgi:hypothetical protein
VSTDEQNAALENLRARVETIVTEMDTRRDDDELLGTLDELRGSGGPAPTSETRARIAALPLLVAERLPDSSASRLPGGSLVHRAIAKATRRQDDALLKEIRGLAAQVGDRMLELNDAAPPLLSGSIEQAMDQIHAVADKIALLEGHFAAMLSRIEALETRLDGTEPLS